MPPFLCSSDLGLARVIQLAATVASLAIAATNASAQSIVLRGRSNATNFDNLTDVRQLSMSSQHYVALTGAGVVACWGSNASGQCDVPAGLQGVVSVEAGGGFSIAVLADGSVRQWGAMYAQPTGFGAVHSVSASDNSFVLARRADGTAGAWGSSGVGAAEVVPADLGQVSQVSAGLYFGAALRANGTVACWGSNFYQQCNVPQGLSGVASIETSWGGVYALKNDGSVVAWGQAGVPPEVELGLIRCIDIGAGVTHAVFLLENRQLRCTGQFPGGPCGWMGLEPAAEVVAGSNAMAIITTEGRVRAWGGTEYIALHQLPDQSGPAASIVSGGEVGALSIDVSGEVHDWWGTGSWGWDPAEPLGENPQLAVGTYHALARRTDGTVIGWGPVNGSALGTNGNFGQANVPSDLGPVQLVAAGGAHSLALRNDSVVVCWGANSSGQCAVPADLAGVVELDGGTSHSVARTAAGTVVCWGGTGGQDYGQCAVPAGLANVARISGGFGHTVAMRADGSIVSWGSESQAVANIPKQLPTVIDAQAGRGFTVCLDAQGGVHAWGGTFAEYTLLATSGVEQVAPRNESVAMRLCTPEPVMGSSGNLGPIGAGVPRQHTFACPRAPAGDGRITLRIQSDLGAANESVSVQLDGVTFATRFGATGSDCPSTPDVATVDVPLDTLASLVADGTLVVRLVASAAVSATQCANGSCLIELAYPAELFDCDGNGIDDGCELAGGDADGNGRLDACESRGDLDANGVIDGRDLSLLLIAWGTGDQVTGDIDGDGLVDSQDLAILLANWG